MKLSQMTQKQALTYFDTTIDLHIEMVQLNIDRYNHYMAKSGNKDYSATERYEFQGTALQHSSKLNYHLRCLYTHHAQINDYIKLCNHNLTALKETLSVQSNILNEIDQPNNADLILNKIHELADRLSDQYHHKTRWTSLLDSLEQSVRDLDPLFKSHFNLPQ